MKTLFNLMVNNKWCLFCDVSILKGFTFLVKKDENENLANLDLHAHKKRMVFPLIQLLF